jgi:nucleoside-diphosphate-sugar epimerase
MKKSILIIGGTGFLGQSFFDYVNKEKLKTFNLSKIIVVSRKRKKIQTKLKTTFIKKSITDIIDIPVTDYIIYAANSTNNLENLKGIDNFTSLLTDKHKKTKILFTSSGAVYGLGKTKKRFKELDPVNFKKVSTFKGYKKEYAKSKIIMENRFIELGKKGFNVSIARLFTFIGKRILINKDFAITNLIKQAQNLKINKIFLSSSKDVYRGYMNAEDLVRWIIKILVKSNPKCNIYNVGSDEAITIKQLAGIIAKKYNKQVSIKSKNRSKKNIDYYVPSITKAKKELNLKNKFDFKKSLDQILNV